MSIHIDPIELTKFSTKASAQSAELYTTQLDIHLPQNILGSFEEANDLVTAINLHTAEVNKRIRATSSALLKLSQAAGTAATMSGLSDADIASKMKNIDGQVDQARRDLTPGT